MTDLASPTFGSRLGATFAEFGHLCVGIDPHPYLLDAWGLGDSAEGLREFGLRVVDAAGGRAGIIKPQVAFFERHGSAGFAALEKVLGAARASGLLVIADVKRGDLGTTVEAYGQAWLTPGSPLEADAMTISAYQGVGALAAPFALAAASGKGLFVLAATSNPEARSLQTAIVAEGEYAGRTVAAGIVADVDRLNTDLLANDGSLNAAGPTSPLGPIGVVIGATISLQDYAIGDDELVRTPILAPGFGHQGAVVSDLRSIYGAASDGVIVSSSRALLDAGPDGIAAAITASAREIAGVYA